MILLLTPSERASDCAAALHSATGYQVMTADTLAFATTLLRTDCYRLVVLDQHLLEAEPGEGRTVIEHLGTAIPVPVNLAITGIDRLIREVRLAFERRNREEIQARHAAAGRLRSELNGTLTALLLSVASARETPDLRHSASEKLQSVHELIEGLRRQLESSG